MGQRCERRRHHRTPSLRRRPVHGGQRGVCALRGHCRQAGELQPQLCRCVVCAGCFVQVRATVLSTSDHAQARVAPRHTSVEHLCCLLVPRRAAAPLPTLSKALMLVWLCVAQGSVIVQEEGILRPRGHVVTAVSVQPAGNFWACTLHDAIDCIARPFSPRVATSPTSRDNHLWHVTFSTTSFAASAVHSASQRDASIGAGRAAQLPIIVSSAEGPAH